MSFERCGFKVADGSAFLGVLEGSGVDPGQSGPQPPTPIRSYGTGAAPFEHSSPQSTRHLCEQPLVGIGAAQ
jgi:hypothetical protein